MLTVKETLNAKTFTYQITNEFGEAQPFTVLNLYRHIGYPMRVIQNEMSDGNDAVINLSKRYLPITMLWYGEQRLQQFYDEHWKKLTTAYTDAISKVLKAYRKFNERAEFYRTPETKGLVEEDRKILVPIFTQELTKFYLTADNMTNSRWKDDNVRRAFIEILTQRIMVRIVIEDTLHLNMEMDKEMTDLDTAQAKALTTLCGGNHTGVQTAFRLYREKMEKLSLMEINIIFNKLQEHLNQIAETEMGNMRNTLQRGKPPKRKQRPKQPRAKKTKTAEPEQQATGAAPEPAAPEQTAKPKTMNARAQERALDPNRRGKTIKEKKAKPKAQTMDESLAALQEKFNRR